MKTTIKLISIEGRWGQPIYPPKPPIPKLADLLPERIRLRPQALALMNSIIIRNQESHYAR
jgi:hypothetical protein